MSNVKRPSLRTINRIWSIVSILLILLSSIFTTLVPVAHAEVVTTVTTPTLIGTTDQVLSGTTRNGEAGNCYVAGRDYIFYMNGTNGNIMSTNSTDALTWSRPIVMNLSQTQYDGTGVDTACAGNTIYALETDNNRPRSTWFYEYIVNATTGHLTLTYKTDVAYDEIPKAIAIDKAGDPWIALAAGGGISPPPSIYFYTLPAGHSTPTVTGTFSLVNDPAVYNDQLLDTQIVPMSDGSVILMWQGGDDVLHASRTADTGASFPLTGLPSLSLPSSNSIGGVTSVNNTMILGVANWGSETISEFTISPETCPSCSWAGPTTIGSTNSNSGFTSLSAATAGSTILLFYSFTTNTHQHPGPFNYPDSVGMLYSEDLGATWSNYTIVKDETPQFNGFPLWAGQYPFLGTPTSTSTSIISLLWCQGSNTGNCQATYTRVEVKPQNIDPVTITVTTNPSATVTSVSTVVQGGVGGVVTVYKDVNQYSTSTVTKQNIFANNSQVVVDSAGAVGGAGLGAGVCFAAGWWAAIICGVAGLFGFVGFAGAFPNIALLLALAVIFLDLTVIPAILRKRSSGGNR